MSLLIKSLRQAPARRTDVDVPRSFLGFCEWLGVKLTPGQSALWGILTSAPEPVDRDVARQIFGGADLDNLPMGCRDVGVICAGARSGKSYLGALFMVWSLYVSDLRSLAPGQRAVALVIAPNDKLRKECVNYARGAIQAKPELKATMIEDSADGFTVRRTDGHEVRFEAGVATPGGYGARGRSLCAFMTDEVAFFRDKDHAVSDEEIFRAGSARVLPGCKTLVASTPWAKTGLLYELYKANFGNPKTALVAHAPTLLMHSSEMTRTLVAREYARDEVNADREFGASFLSSAIEDLFSEDLLMACVDPTINAEVPGDVAASPA